MPRITKNGNVQGVVSTALPQDLFTAVRVRAETEGLSISEFMRAIISQWIYGNIPSVDEGYRAGRQAAITIASARLGSLVPKTYEEALEFLDGTQRLFQAHRPPP